MIAEQTFPKSFRLLKPSEFQTVYKHGQWASNRELSINVVKHSKPSSRLGITVSKKVSKRAVDRNRIKRHIREWYRKNKHRCHNFDIVLTAKPAIQQKTMAEIQLSLEDIWRKLQKKL
ncbi:MAG: ribonuclease P protein component [Arenicella sp.]